MMVSSVQARSLALRPHARIVSASSLAQAKALVTKRGAPRLIVADLNLPDSNGLATLLAVKALAPDATIVVFSAEVDDAIEQTARADGCQVRGGQVQPDAKLCAGDTGMGERLRCAPHGLCLAHGRR